MIADPPVPDAAESWTLRLLTRVGRLLDGAVLHGMALAFERALLRPLEEFPRLRAAAAPYTSADLVHDPGRFFAFVREPVGAPRWTAEGMRVIPGGRIVTRRFASAYEPYHAVDLDAADPCPENDTAWVEHWIHDPGPPRGTVLALHGFTMGSPRIDARVMMVERWFRSGLDVALLTLPFHGRRASRRCRYSGERFASWHAGRLNEAVRQSVHDAHLVSRWLAVGTDAPVGLLGLSLGGYIAALLAGLRDDLAFAIPVVPAVCLAYLPTRLFTLHRRGRVGGPPLGMAELEQAYRVHSPLSHPLRLPRERVLLVGGRGDEVAPLAHVSALWEHWGRPGAVWFSGGHVTVFQRARVASAVEQQMRTTTRVHGRGAAGAAAA